MCGIKKLGIIFLFFSSVLNAKLVPPSEQNPVGNSDNCGFVRMERNFDDLFGMPAIVKNILLFSSDPRKEPGVFGAYWSLPLLDSKISAISQGQLEWRALNGMTYFLYKRETPTNKETKVKYDHRSGRWIAIHDKNTVEISSQIDSKCVFVYTDGMLSKFCLGKGNDTYKVYYNGNKKLAFILNESKNKKVLIASYAKSGSEIKSLSINGREYSFEYSMEKIFTGNSVAILSKITYPEKEKIETFKFSKPGKKSRSVIFNGFKETTIGEVDVYRIDIGDNYVEWCAKTGMIMEDSGGKYKTGNDTFDQLHPGWKKSKHPIPRKSTVVRQRKDAPYPDLFSYDWDNSVKVIGNGTTGDIFRYFNISASGPAFMKTRKVEKLFGKYEDLSEGRWDIVAMNSYDDKGNLVRVMDAQKNITEYKIKKLKDDILVYETYLEGVLTKISKYKDGLPFETSVHKPDGNIETYKYMYKAIDGQNVKEKYVNGEFVESHRYYEHWNYGKLAHYKNAEGLEIFHKYINGLTETMTRFPDGREELRKYDIQRKEVITFSEKNLIDNWKSTFRENTPMHN